MPDLEMKSLQTALPCHEDYTRKQIDVHGQSSVRARKSDLRRDMELRGGVGGEVEAEHHERCHQCFGEGGALNVPRARGALPGVALFIVFANLPLPAPKPLFP